MKWIPWIFCLCVGWGAVGCTEPVPPSLNGKDRRLLDSLYRDTANAQRILLDSLCDLQYDALVPRVTDSILDKRLRERKRQLDRLKSGSQ